MSMPMPVAAVPQSPDGFYAINNQFLTIGPKGFLEYKMLDNEDMFLRMDLPGVPEEGVTVSLDSSKKIVTVYGDAPKIHIHDYSDRTYITFVGLVCSCCEMSGFTSHMADGVLRLTISKTFINQGLNACIGLLSRPAEEDLPGAGPYRFFHGMNFNDPTLTGPELKPHPWVQQGSKMAYESKRLQNGSLYVRVDMPGVPDDDFLISIDNGIVHVDGEAPAVSHDSSYRFYSGVVAKFPDNIGVCISRITTIAKDGVFRLLIPHI